MRRVIYRERRFHGASPQQGEGRHGRRHHGGIVGVVAGSVRAQHERDRCTGDFCALSALAVPVSGGIGLIAGAVIGAAWPTH